MKNLFMYKYLLLESERMRCLYMKLREKFTCVGYFKEICVCAYVCSYMYKRMYNPAFTAFICNPKS